MPDPLYSRRYASGWAITPSDTQPLQGPVQANGKHLGHCSAIHALTSGNVTAKFADDQAAAPVFPVIAGEIYPYKLSNVYLATTASLMALL